MVLDRPTVLFDVDGTIAETEGDGHLPAFNQAFREFSLAWNWSVDDYAELLKITGGFERMVAHAARIGDSIAQTAAGHQTLRAVHQRKNALYAQRLAGGEIAPRRGFVALVRAIAAAGRQWAVVTTTSRSNWEELWRHAICRGCSLPAPAIAICGEDVARKKPDPEAYLLALSRLGITAADAIAIEDSRNGLLAAQAAGIDTVIVRSRFFGHQEFPEAQRVVNELSELI